MALHVFEWAGDHAQAALLPSWQVIRREQDLAAVAGLIVGTERTRFSFTEDGTAIGTALTFAAEVMLSAPPCSARTIDVSGHRVNNLGLGPDEAYASSALDGVTVNALIIASTAPNIDPWQNEELVAYFVGEVLHGPGAFCILADGYEDYERAVIAKLRRELEVPLVSGDIVGPNSG